MTTFKAYQANLDRILQGTEVKLGDVKLELESGIRAAQSAIKNTHNESGKVYFVGNGGSSAIASHMALDYFKAGGFTSLTFSDAAALTAISNDLGYDQVYSYQIGRFGCPSDILVAISSSGSSPNILNAVRAGISKKMYVITLSGFKFDNPLRAMGDINFYCPSQQYGFTELSHHIILHMMLDTMKD